MRFPRTGSGNSRARETWIVSSANLPTGWRAHESQIRGLDPQLPPGQTGLSSLNVKPDLPPYLPPDTGVPAGRPRRRRRVLYILGAFVGLVVVICATVMITVWYLQRPIKPVVLSPPEKAVVEAKLERINKAPTDSRPPAENVISRRPPDRPYEAGSKTLRLTERELNGLLNQNTELGKTVRLELGQDAINAYVATLIPKDVPILGGKMFRARGRFHLSVTNGAAPSFILEDVTVFGLSLPKAWLGGLKGENLLADATGQRRGGPVLRGIKSLRVEPGALVLEVED